MTNIMTVLKERGFIEAATSDELEKFVETPIRVYAGFDPTADSLHLGNMVAIMGLAWFKRYGHGTYAIVGGATGMIGDPSGKSKERQQLNEDSLVKNLAGIRKNLESILLSVPGGPNPVVLNNFDWFKEINCLHFLREIGKYFRMGPMLAKDSVKSRLSSSEGISYTEFSYQLLQGYDFLHLYQNHQVSIQLGGSDQWGNITAGTDLIRKVLGKPAYGATFPLLTRSDGQKFGKSEKGAIWLSPEKLSPYEFYQYLYRVSDEDVLTLMRMLTFMEMEEIHRYAEQMKREDYTANTAQKRLAEEVTQLVHGPEGLGRALKTTLAASPGSETTLDVATLESLAEDLPNCECFEEEILGAKLIDFMVKIGLHQSKGEARRLMKNGGVYLNNEKITDEALVLHPMHLIDGKLMLFGKKNKFLVRVRH